MCLCVGLVLVIPVFPMFYLCTLDIEVHGHDGPYTMHYFVPFVWHGEFFFTLIVESDFFFPVHRSCNGATTPATNDHTLNYVPRRAGKDYTLYLTRSLI